MQIKELDKLYEKQRENSKLGKGDAQKAYDIVLQLLEEDNILVYDYLMKLSPEYGVLALIEHMKSLRDEKLISEKIQIFLNHDEFQKNPNNMGYKRGLVLAAEVFNNKFSFNQTIKVLGETCKIGVITSKSGINSQIARYTYQDFIDSIDNLFFNIEVKNNKYLDNYGDYIEQILINTIFADKKFNIDISTKEQMDVLIFLSHINNSSKLSKDEIQNMNYHISTWADEIKEVLLNHEEVMRKYEKYIDKQVDTTEIEISSKDHRKSLAIKGQDEDKKVDEKTIFNKLLEDIGKLEKRFLIKDKQVNKLIANLDFYKGEYEKFKKQSEDLQRKLDNLIEKNQLVMERNKALNLENNSIKDELNKLKENERRYQEQVDEVFSTNEIMKRSAVDGFKKKLGSSLRMYYQDFMDIQDEVVDEEMGEIMKIKVKEMFEELQRQGIQV